MQTSEVLEKAADELERHGWRQGSFGTNKGAKCASGAIRFVVTGDAKGYHPAIHAPLAALGCAIPKSFIVTSWNDAKGREAERVVLLMRQVARKCRRRGE